MKNKNHMQSKGIVQQSNCQVQEVVVVVVVNKENLSHFCIKKILENNNSTILST